MIEDIIQPRNHHF